MTRVVLLGASNLAIGFPSIVRRIAAGLPRPLTIFAAIGHGRSYCAWSRVLFRGLPGIDRCSLWDDLDQSAETPAPTLALLTDVGNDLVYGTGPAIVARRIEECLTRLAAQRAEIVITRLPLASVERLSALRFHATKAIFFPGTRGTWPAMLDHARELDEILCALGDRFSAQLIEPPLEWYGFDPIHIRRQRREHAWQTVFSSWPSFQTNGATRRLALADHVRLRLAPPAERRLFGRPQRRLQPSLRFEDVPIRLY